MDLNKLLNVGLFVHGQGTANTLLDVVTPARTAGAQGAAGIMTERVVPKGIILSASAAPAAAVRVLLFGDTGGAGSPFWTMQVPNAAFGGQVIPFFGGLRPAAALLASGDKVTLRIPALGAGVVADATLFYDYEA